MSSNLKLTIYLLCYSKGFIFHGNRNGVVYTYFPDIMFSLLGHLVQDTKDYSDKALTQEIEDLYDWKSRNV